METTKKTPLQVLLTDNLWYGIVLGIVAPIIGLLGFYFFKFKALTFTEYLQFISVWKTLFTSIISVSLVGSAALFTLFINYRKDKTARGIFICTLIYAIVTISVKYFG
jgi:arginine/ornithine N-succinyltransferase beta subunit